MRRIAFLAAGSAVLLMFGAAPAFADNGPHVKGAGVLADGCAGCHRVHTAKASGLLKEAQPQLCYTCHGTTGTGAKTDVQGGVGYSSTNRDAPTAALRGGGFSYALIGSGTPSDGMVPALTTGAAVTSTHSVEGAGGPAWGNGPISATQNYGKSIQLRCGTCHDPHGNGNYRILRPIPNDSGATADVAIADAATPAAKVYTTANYWNAADGNAPGFIANVSAWCSTCHTRYLASGDGDTPSGDAVYSYRHKSNSTTSGGASCIKCHVSHGSNASMGEFSSAVHNPDDTVATGNSKLLRIDNRGTCQMCHDK